MSKTREERWMDSYMALTDYVRAHRQLPDKKKVENRGLLNWWKYNRKCAKKGSLDDRKIEMLRKLNELRENKNVEW